MIVIDLTPMGYAKLVAFKNIIKRANAWRTYQINNIIVFRKLR